MRSSDPRPNANKKLPILALSTQGGFAGDLRELRGLKELAGRHTLIRRPLVTTRTYTGQAKLEGYRYRICTGRGALLHHRSQPVVD